MKKQILTFIIGVLVGAAITAAIFLIFKPKAGRNAPDFSKFERNGEKFNPGDEDFDPSKFNPGERRKRNSSDTKDDSKVEEKETKDTNNEKQG